MLTSDVLFVPGSLRRGSYNTALLREAANALPSGVDHAWLDGIAGLPPYSEDDDGERAPAAVERLRRIIAAAGAVLIATPEYNASIPGGLKNAVDWAARPYPENPWREKPVAVIGAELAVGGAHEAFLPSGALRDPGHATGLRDVVAALVDAQPGRKPELAGPAGGAGGVRPWHETHPDPRRPRPDSPLKPRHAPAG